MNNKILKLLPALFTIIVAGVVFCVFGKHTGKSSLSELSGSTAAGISEADTSAEPEIPGEGIWVYIYGCVVHPGVYYLEKGARAFEAVAMAGGLKDDAQDGSLNMAMQLEDGQQIYIPDSRIQTDPDSAFSAADKRVNINTASKEELMSLPGIGEAKAEAIITYRSQQLFTAIEEIMNVSGIKESSFEKIRELIRV